MGAPTPTATNVFAVFDTLRRHSYIPARVPSVDHRHIKRVLDWGGLTPREGGGFKLTSEGASLLVEHGYPNLDPLGRLANAHHTCPACDPTVGIRLVDDNGNHIFHTEE